MILYGQYTSLEVLINKTLDNVLNNKKMFSITRKKTLSKEF